MRVLILNGSPRPKGNTKQDISQMSEIAALLFDHIREGEYDNLNA